MADPAHLALLAEGTFSWNTWRRDHPQIQPDLRGANLSEAELTGADLEGTDLEGLGVDLHDADL